MSDHLKTEQAKAIAALLPRLMQGLFSVVNDPALDLPLAQLRVCRNLCDGPRSMSVLSRELGVSLSAMTQLADRLERANLVSRVAAHADRRVRCLQLTPQGEKMMRLRDNYRVKRVLAVLNNISPDARRQIHQSLETFLQASLALRADKAHHRKETIRRRKREAKFITARINS